ncbi:MAG TPA: TlpA disulfide reductase family protein [Casimicrobiaceae bacterium]|nr:TlpA disulfide reductase family protein [Casimicrobiaceae bacterium]
MTTAREEGQALSTTPPPPVRRFTARRGVLTALVLAVVALALGVYFGAVHRGAPTLSGDTLFALSLPDAQGREQKLAQWRGKVLVVNFWATWCAPCREEMPEFIKAQNEFGARGLQFVGIAVDDAAKVKAYVEEIGLNYPALVGGFGAIDLSRGFGNAIMALPYTIVIDRSGKIVHTQLGPLPPAKLKSLLRDLL